VQYRVIAAAAALVLLAAPAARAENREVVIVNKTGTDIAEFYASNVGTNDWEEDILGVDVLPSGERVTVNIDDGSGACKFDFRAVFADGDEAVKGNVNVCEIETFNFTQ